MKLPGALLGYAKEFAQSLIVFLIASYPAGAIKWLALDQEQSIEVQQRISKQNCFRAALSLCFRASFICGRCFWYLSKALR
jgi:hypothetical protein